MNGNGFIRHYEAKIEYGPIVGQRPGLPSAQYILMNPTRGPEEEIVCAVNDARGNQAVPPPSPERRCALHDEGALSERRNQGLLAGIGKAKDEHIFDLLGQSRPRFHRAPSAAADSGK